MPEPTTDRAIAQFIADAWLGGRSFDALPAAGRPETRAGGYAVQQHLGEVFGEEIGWKIAATSEAGQRHINVDGPLAGRLFKSRQRAVGSPVSLAGIRMLVAEPEFAFRFARALEPKGRAYSEAEVMAAVGSMHLAIEIPNSRFADFTKAGTAQLIADNACAHDVVIGPAVSASWRAIDLAAHAVVITSGAKRNEGKGANALGDPRRALTWLVNEVTGQGLSLREGAVVITGTVAVPIVIAPGETVTVDFGAFGRLSVPLVA
jgi:2-keto-4-pentenoate hydratase